MYDPTRSQNEASTALAEGKKYHEIQFSQPLDQDLQRLQVAFAAKWGETATDAALVFTQMGAFLADLPSTARDVTPWAIRMASALEVLGQIVAEALGHNTKEFDKALAEHYAATQALIDKYVRVDLTDGIPPVSIRVNPGVES